MGKKKEILLYVIDAETKEGRPRRFLVYQVGGGFEIADANLQRHRCHVSVKTVDDIEHEIALTYGAKVIRTKRPGEK